MRWPELQTTKCDEFFSRASPRPTPRNVHYWDAQSPRITQAQRTQRQVLKAKWRSGEVEGIPKFNGKRVNRKFQKFKFIKSSKSSRQIRWFGDGTTFNIFQCSMNFNSSSLELIFSYKECWELAELAELAPFVDRSKVFHHLVGPCWVRQTTRGAWETKAWNRLPKKIPLRATTKGKS